MQVIISKSRVKRHGRCVLTSTAIKTLWVMQDVGSCPESLVARGQARLFGVAGSNPPGSVSTSLSDSNVSVSLIHACGVNHPCIVFLFLYLFKMWDVCWNFLKPAILNPVQRLHREHVITTTSDRNAIAL